MDRRVRNTRTSLAVTLVVFASALLPGAATAQMQPPDPGAAARKSEEAEKQRLDQQARAAELEEVAPKLSVRSLNEAALWFADAEPHASDAVWIEALRREGLCQGLVATERRELRAASLGNRTPLALEHELDRATLDRVAAMPPKAPDPASLRDGVATRRVGIEWVVN